MYPTDIWLCCYFHEYCLSVVIMSCIWNVTNLLCFCGAIAGSTLIPLVIPCINLATKMTQHHLCGYGCPDFGCAVRFNPWYAKFILGIHSSKNQPPCSYLIVELLSLLCANNCKWSHWKPFLWLTVFCRAVMLCFMAKHSALVILCGSCS